MIVFETPGLIDGRSLTVVGLSAKPESISPIGRYGTGLKYAIAVLVRLGADVRIFIGRDEHHFVKRKDEFRGKTYEKIVMRRLRRSWKNWRETELPFTTDYGLNWKVWQVFRELEANTRDEHGRTFRVDGDDNVDEGIEGKTRIVVNHPEFDAAWEKRDEVFLPGVSFASGAGVQIKRGLNNEDLRTASIYWRGLKVYEMGKPGLMTYNLLEPHVNLTEDRTLASEWWARYYLARWLVGCDDERVIEKIVTAPEGCWEHGLEFDTALPPSAAFHRVMLRHPKATAMAWGYYARYDQRVTEKTFSPFEAHKLPWKVEGMKVVDAGGRPIFDAPYGYQGKWDIVAAAMLDKVNPKAAEEPEPVVLCAEEENEVADDIAARTLASAADPTYVFRAKTDAEIVEDVYTGGELLGLNRAEITAMLPSAEERTAYTERAMNEGTPGAENLFSVRQANDESEELYTELEETGILQTEAEVEAERHDAEDGIEQPEGPGAEPPEPERPTPDEEERS